MTKSGQDRYRQELSREISPMHNVLITLSGVSPATSVFVIVPAVITTAGTGSIMAMVFAAIICAFMAFCWAELGAAYPITGGNYPLVYHAFREQSRLVGSALSFTLFALEMTTGILAPAVVALSIPGYLPIAHSVNPTIVAAVLTVLATIVATLNIRINALVTGTFLAIELVALSSLVVLGLVNYHSRIADVLHHWVIGGSQGVLVPVPFAAIPAAAAAGIYAYNGFNGPVYYSEETRGTASVIARAILWSLAIGVVTELIPTMSVIFGAPDLAKITASNSPITDFILVTSGSTLNAIVSLGMALAIFNAIIATDLSQSRILYASGRDRAYPGVLSDWLAKVHPRFRSPWVATLVQGLPSAIFCLTVSQDTLIKVTGTSLVFSYSFIAISAIVGRANGATRFGPYKMPLWPVLPILSIVALLYIATQQQLNLLLITLTEMAIGLVWWAVVILPQRDKAWVLKQPTLDEAEAASEAITITALK